MADSERTRRFRCCARVDLRKPEFLYLLVAFILFYPASGAFVNLSQATLMDSETDRHEQNMARRGFDLRVRWAWC